MTEDQRKRKAVQAVQALLELDGFKMTIKDVAERIGDDLGDLMKVKDKIANDMRAAVVQEEKSDRKKIIGEFIVRNWDLIKDIEEVKSTLLNGYCLGRYSKEKREEMKSELVSQAIDAGKDHNETSDADNEVLLGVSEEGGEENKEYTF